MILARSLSLTTFDSRLCACSLCAVCVRVCFLAFWHLLDLVGLAPNSHQVIGLKTCIRCIVLDFQVLVPEVWNAAWSARRSSHRIIMSGCHWLAQLWQRFGRMGVWLELVFVPFNLLYTILQALGPPLWLYCNGPTPWKCSQGYLFDPTVMM